MKSGGYSFLHPLSRAFLSFLDLPSGSGLSAPHRTKFRAKNPPWPGGPGHFKQGMQRGKKGVSWHPLGPADGEPPPLGETPPPDVKILYSLPSARSIGRNCMRQAFCPVWQESLPGRGCPLGVARSPARRVRLEAAVRPQPQEMPCLSQYFWWYSSALLNVEAGTSSVARGLLSFPEAVISSMTRRAAARCASEW